MSDVPILVPEGKTASDLTMGELDAASNHVSADVLECLSGSVPGKRYAAFVEVAVMWARRGGTNENREQLRKRFRDYTPDEMFQALRFGQALPEPPDPTGLSDEQNGPSSLGSSGDSPTS